MRHLGFPNLNTLVGPDQDLLHFPGGLPTLPGDVPVVLSTVHGFAHIKAPEAISDDVKRRLDKLYATSLERSSHFITVSETNKNELHEIYGVPRSKIRAIPLGISPEFSRYELRSEEELRLRDRFGIAPGKCMLYVGAVEPHKNIATIIRAFSIFCEQEREPWNLVLVGKKNPHTHEYESKAARLGLSDRVCFVDYLQPGSADLADLYNLARVMVFPTYYEGWASPPLEAMISGTPVIASKIPSLLESTGGRAIYTEPDDTDDIAAQMLRLAQDSEFYEAHQRSGEEFAAEYTWSRCVERTFEYYQDLVMGEAEIATEDATTRISASAS